VSVVLDELHAGMLLNAAYVKVIATKSAQQDLLVAKEAVLHQIWYASYASRSVILGLQVTIQMQVISGLNR